MSNLRCETNIEAPWSTRYAVNRRPLDLITS